MRLQVLEVTRLRKGQAGARTSRKEKGKGYAAGFRGCVVRRFGLHVFLYSAQSGQYVEDHARSAILSTLAKLEKRIATLQQLEASIAINPLAVQPPYPPEEKQELSQTWDRAPEPAEKPSSPLGGLSMDPPSSLGYSDDNPPKGGLPELKL